MAINVSVKYKGGTVDKVTTVPSGNLFECHVEVLSLQPIYETVYYYCSV